MRAVIQKVRKASVHANGILNGEIQRGLLIFLGIHKNDNQEDLEWLIHKIPQIRIFEDNEGRMNRSVNDVDGDIMVISQFTLFGNLRKGSRPSFNRAARPETAIPMYDAFIKALEKETGKPVARGKFGSHMDIVADNDGPVTLVIDTQDKHF